MDTPHTTNSTLDRLRQLPRSVRSHPVVTAILVVAAVAAVVFSVLIGLNVVVPIALLVMVGALALLLGWWWSRRTPDAQRSSARVGQLGLAAVALSGVLTFGIIQLVPYGRAHSNPPVTGEPQWADARTRELMVDTCFACHSNEVEYPPYASVAPISWGIQHHVDEGREKVNYSEFATNPGEAEESVDVIEEGEMPPSSFTRFGLHPEANLSDAELQELVAGLRATPGMTEGGGD